jgi:hypothetical protein
VRIADAARRRRFAEEALDDVRIRREMGVEQFERAPVLGDEMLDLVDRAHSPGAEQPHDAQLAREHGSGLQDRGL